MFKKGDKKIFTKRVTQQDIAAFEAGVVHHVYATFSIARDAEWSGRLFVLEMKNDLEEGIGTSITVHHKSPAFVNDEIVFTSTFEEITKNGEIITTYTAYCGTRLIASGTQGQRIIPIQKIAAIFAQYQKAI